MFKRNRMLSAGLVLAWVLLGGITPALWSQESAGSVVIIFKDGHRQSIPLAQVARIEFEHVGAPAPAVGRSRFTGEWKVGVGGGLSGTFVITLNPNGTAHKDIDGGGNGTWLVVNGEAQIAWEDGWHDVIRKQAGKFQKAAYAPGKSVDDASPDSVASAEYQEPN
jgi:hypothetical protein